jgi:DNA-binding XRE family transcriptional regulator
MALWSPKTDLKQIQWLLLIVCSLTVAYHVSWFNEEKFKEPVMEDETLKRLGIRIRRLREFANISQETLGHISGLHRTYIGAIERGERNPSVLSLKKIADALRISLGDLFDE